MGDAKHERILETLKQRITQLEEELRTTKTQWQTALDERTECKKEMELLRTEAHDVVGQWEKEATDVRRKLDHSERQVSKLSHQLRDSEQAKEKLRERVAELEKASSDSSSSLAAQQEKYTELDGKQKELAEALTKSRSEFAEALQQIKEYEGLTAAMQQELQKSSAAEVQSSRELEELRESLSKAKTEMELVRSQKDEISAQAEKLISRIDELKALNEKLCDDTELSQQHARARHAEVENLKLKLSDQESSLGSTAAEIASLRAEKEKLTEEVSKLTSSLTDAENVSKQQLEIISGLEKDVQALEDSAVVQRKFIEEYQEARTSLENELSAVAKAKEEAEAQFAAIKECYSTEVIEASNFKERSEKTKAALESELSQTRMEMSEALRHSDQRCSAAIESVRQLNDSLKNTQIRELVARELSDRQVVELGSLVEMQSFITIHLQQMVKRCQHLHCTAKDAEQANSVLSEANKELLSSLEATKAKANDADEELVRMRAMFASLESRAAASATEVKAAEEKNTSLERDNAWLKEQVDAMRTELGDLDELLNANLNQMQEENERHVASIHSLQKLVDEQSAKERDLNTHVSQLEKKLLVLENEYAAQTKTLDIAESDLRAATEDASQLQNALSQRTARLEQADQRVSELTRSNSLLTTQNETLKEQLRGQEEKQQLIMADKRMEVDKLRNKLNQYVEKAEHYAAVAAEERQQRELAEKSAASSKDTATKLRGAVEELKGRCATDAASLKQLIDERDDLLRDRDIIVERYNRLHDAFRNLRREANSKVGEELRKMLEFSTQQETELQQLRRENLVLKKSVSMFVTSAQPKAEAVFMERLNLTEGPLRHPKKRSVTAAPETVEQ